MPDYDWLARWSTFGGVATAAERDRLRDRARRSPAADVALLDRELREARRHQRLTGRRGALETGWEREADRLDRLLWPLALDAAGVFGSERVRRLKQCGGDRCGWLFLDSTRNHSRQWCDMGVCGNLAKVRCFRQRQRRH